MVRVIDGAGSRHGKALQERLEKALLKIPSADLIPQHAFGGAARRKGISPRDWLTRDALPVILDDVGADYVLVGRLLRPSSWDYELQLVMVDRRMRDGLTKKKTFRCLKRYVAREVYPLLRPAPTGHITQAAA